MSRVFIEGFELKHLQNWTQNNWMVISTYSTAIGLTGNYSAYGAESGCNLSKDISNQSEMYISARCFFQLNRDNNERLFLFSQGTTYLGYINVDINGYTNHIRAGFTGTTFEGTFNITTGIPYRIEARYKPSTSNTGNFQVKVNGILDIDKTSTITATVTKNIDRITIMCPVDQTYIDDIVFDNSEWPGNTRIQSMMPDGAGTAALWTPSAVDNYDCVNDLSTTITAVDADYVYASSVIKLDAYTMSSLISGTNPITEIKCIQVTARAKIDGVCTANAMKLKVITTSPATYESAAFQVQEDAWAHYTFIKSDTANITVAKMENISIGLETTTV